LWRPNSFGTTTTVVRPHRSAVSTGAVRDASWSKHLETEMYADDETRLLEDALAAMAATRAGHHVTLVTHRTHGHPREYLYGELTDAFGDAIDVRYVEQCGCGGHVTRVAVEKQVAGRE
jgi:putative CGCGG family rSAM target protein